MVFYTPEKIRQIAIDIIVYLQLAGYFFSGKKHPGRAAEHLNISPCFLSGKTLQNGFTQGAFTADSSN